MYKKIYFILLITLNISIVFLVYTLMAEKDKNDVSSFSNQTQSFYKKCTNKQEPTPLEVDTQNHEHLTILNLWYDLDNRDEKLSVRLDPRIKGARKIGFNSRVMAVLKKDDKFQLPIINGKKYLLHVKSIRTKDKKNIEVYGELNHEGKIYASTLSLTGNGVLALLSTPIGHFDVRMAYDKGYIYQSNQLIDIEAVVDLPSFLN